MSEIEEERALMQELDLPTRTQERVLVKEFDEKERKLASERDKAGRACMLIVPASMTN